MSGSPRPAGCGLRAGCRLMQDHFRNIDEDLLVSPYSINAALQGFSEKKKRVAQPSARPRGECLLSSRAQSPRGILNSSNLRETQAKNLLCGQTLCMLKKREAGRVGGRILPQLRIKYFLTTPQKYFNG